MTFERASLAKSAYTSTKEPMKQTWETINSEFHIRQENSSAEIDVLHSIPSTTIEAERGFQNLGEIKNDWRN